jgi:hypothetical protein
MTEGGDHSPEYRGRLTRQHEPDEQSVLGENEQPDDSVHSQAVQSEQPIGQPIHPFIPSALPPLAKSRLLGSGSLAAKGCARAAIGAR